MIWNKKAQLKEEHPSVAHPEMEQVEKRQIPPNRIVPCGFGRYVARPANPNLDVIYGKRGPKANTSIISKVYK